MRVHRSVGVMLVAVLVLVVTSNAHAHIVNATAGIDDDLYYPAETVQCVFSNGNCSVHSFSFASANDLGNTGFFCGEIYKTSYPTGSYSTFLVAAGCAYGGDIGRACLNNGHDSAGPLHCIDQDSTMYKAGAYNGQPGTTIRRHPVY